MSDAAETLVQLYIVGTFPLRISGLYPYSYHPRSRRFKLSYALLLSNIIQLSIYIYVNVSLIWEDWHNYAQPVASSSSLAAVGNLFLRLLAMISTLVVLLPTLLHSRSLVESVNHQLSLVEEFVELGLDTHLLYRQLRFLTVVSCVLLVIWVSLNCWHTVHFYELITGKKATLSYYMVISLSDYYRMLFIFFLRVQLAVLYFSSEQINKSMFDMMKMEKWHFNRRYCLDISSTSANA